MPSLYETRREQMFPKLTPAQLARLDAYGQRQPTRASEVLIESGERYSRIVAVLSGSIDVVRPGLTGEAPITQLTRGDFSGEMSALRGSASFVRIRVQEAGEVISITPESLRRLVQTDAELSELFMRAYILRRMGLMETQHGDDEPRMYQLIRQTALITDRQFDIEFLDAGAEVFVFTFG